MPYQAETAKLTLACSTLGGARIACTREKTQEGAWWTEEGHTSDKWTITVDDRVVCSISDAIADLRVVEAELRKSEVPWFTEAMKLAGIAKKAFPQCMKGNFHSVLPVAMKSAGLREPSASFRSGVEFDSVA